MSIDLGSIDSSFASTYITSLVGNLHRDILMPVVLEKLEQEFPCFQPGNIAPIAGRKINNSNVPSKIDEIIVDSIGPTNFYIPNIRMATSFLAGRKPKLYILPYIFLAKCINATLTLWLDDVIATFKHPRSHHEQNELNSYYKDVLLPYEIKITVSSEYFPNLVIPDWLIIKARELSWDEFVSVLPYHTRNPNHVRIFDIIHLLWESLVLSQCDHDYFVTADNTKAQFLKIRKLCGVKRNIIFIPKLSVDLGDMSIYTLGKSGKIFQEINVQLLDQIFNVYALAFNKPTNIPTVHKREMLASYISSIYQNN